jgi:outer membrane protein assembly factor BamB
LIALALSTMLVVGTGLLRYLSLPGDVLGSAAVEFQKADIPVARSALKASQVPWPTWGGNAARTRVIDSKLHPPYRVLWTMRAHALIELPPAEGYGKLYVGSHSGRLAAVDIATGAIVWERDLESCIASSPAVGAGVVYLGLMGPSGCKHPYGSHGAVVALDVKTGHTLWSYPAGIVESSPLLVGHMLYFGAYRDDQHGTFYAVDIRNHKRAWRLSGVDKVAGAAAFRHGIVYFASYNRNVYAVKARSGALLWQAQALKAPLPDLTPPHGFYATPALAYGRVFIGGIDGRMYAFGATSGHLLWARSVHAGGPTRLLRASGLEGNIYASAAVYRQRVFVGSNDHRFYALDAVTGKVLWSFTAAGKIIGSPTVMNGLVYFSTTNNHTYALDIYRGQEQWSFADGGYSPLLADSKRVYLVGQGRVYGLQESDPPVYGPHIAR